MGSGPKIGFTASLGCTWSLKSNVGSSRAGRAGSRNPLALYTHRSLRARTRRRGARTDAIRADRKMVASAAGSPPLFKRSNARGVGTTSVTATSVALARNRRRIVKMLSDGFP